MGDAVSGDNNICMCIGDGVIGTENMRTETMRVCACMTIAYV